MPSITLAQLRAAVWAQLDDNTALYPSDQVDRAIRDALNELNLFTGIFQSVVSLPTVAGASFYSVPSSITVVLAVHLNGRPLRRTSLRNLNLRIPNWRSATTASHGPVSLWAPVGDLMIAIYPKEMVSGRTLQLAGVVEPPELGLDSDLVYIPDEMVDAVEHMAALSLQMKEGGKIFADAAPKYLEFQKQVRQWQIWRGIKHPRFLVEAERPKEG